MFTLKTLSVIVSLFCATPNGTPQENDLLKRAGEIDKMISDLREKQAETDHLRQMLQDGTMVMVPLAFETRDSKLVTAWDFMNDPTRANQIFGDPAGHNYPNWIRSLAAQYIPVRRVELDKLLTMYAIQTYLDMPMSSRKDITQFTKAVIAFPKAIIREWESGKNATLTELNKEKSSIDSALLRLMKTRDMLQTAIKNGEVWTPEPSGDGTFSGEWTSNWGTMKLTQSGGHVSGTYTHAQGTIDGNVSGNILHFHWVQKGNNTKGAGKLILAADGKSFSGTWSYKDDQEEGGGGWTGTKVK